VRLFRFAAVVLAASLLASFWGWPGAPVLAQEDEAAKSEDDPDLAEAEAQGEPAATSGEGQPAAPAADESLLQFTYKSLGPIYTIAFLALSFTLVALIVMNVITLRRQAVIPSPLVEGFEALLNEKKWQEAYEMARGDESFLGHMLSAGLAKVSSGYSQAIEAMQEVGEEESMKLEHRLSYVALIGSISPMVGLLGTVDGMTAAFRQIASSSGTPSPQRLADDICTALVTTVVGLLLAIPAVMFFGIMRNALGRLTLEVGVIGEGLMSRFSSAGAKKA
jgi:biopolymer transport protein ExbB